LQHFQQSLKPLYHHRKIKTLFMKRYIQPTILFAFVMMGTALFIGCKKSDRLAPSVKPDNATSDLGVPGTKGFCSSKNSSELSKISSSTVENLALTQFITIVNTDFVSAGVGGLRDVGSGIISLSGLSGTVTTAYLYWHGVTNSLTDAGNSILVNGSPVTGTNIGYSGPNCWGYENSQAYRADVTSLVQSIGNGDYRLSGFGELNPNGASLIVFFNDGNQSNNRDVLIFDGNDANFEFGGIPGNPNAPADPEGWEATLSGINYTSGIAKMEFHVADGQLFYDGPLLLNNIVLDAGPQIFDGFSVPGANDGPTGNGRLWDIRSYDITSFLSPGINTLELTAGLVNDCLGLIVTLVDLPATEIEVPLDVKPGGCPNPLNVKAKGVLPVAILGTVSFDVTKIDLSTIKLNGVSPKSGSIEDVAAPFTDNITDCSSCTSAGRDGNPDLTLKFENQEIVAALGTVEDGQCVRVQITGKLLPAYGSTAITGVDVVKIISK
jgi:hypothetical protein